MPDHPLSLPLLEKPITIHLTAVYKTAGALLRELSRAVNRGATTLRTESGLPVGTRFTLALMTDALRQPIEVSGVVTSSVKRRRLFEMKLRYDFDPGQSRQLLDSVLALVRREEPSVQPRKEARVPLTLAVVGPGLRGAEGLIENLSPRGCRLALRGARRPSLRIGDRLRLGLSAREGSRARRANLSLEVRWVRPGRSRGSQSVGAAFVGLTPSARARLASLLELRDFRPDLRLETAPRPRARPVRRR